MRTYRLLLVLTALVLLATGCQGTSRTGGSGLEQTRDIPVSKRGTVLEMVSPAEVLVEAYGEYYGVGSSTRAKRNDIDANGTEQALLDARRTSIHVILFEGSAPLLNTPQERAAFQQQSTYFYHPDTLGRYITYEDTRFTSRVIIEDGTGIRLAKRFRINKDRLIDDLTERRVMVARETLLSTAGNPILMVMPEARTGESPLAVLAADTTARQASTVIQSHLTAKGFEVVVPEQTAEITNLIRSQQMLSGQPDFAYQIAISIGSDIYLTFSGYAQEASFGTTRYVATVNAYETTTARLLGSETGYSKERKGDLMVSVEEALNDAVDRVLTRVMNYWKEDMARGVQYKVIVSITPGLDSYDIDSIHMAFMDAVSDVALSSRELVLTNETIDYIIWVNSATHDRALRVYQALKESFERYGTGAVLGRSSMNRKLMQLTIDY